MSLIRNYAYDEKSLVQEAIEIERFLKTCPHQQWAGFYTGGPVTKWTVSCAKQWLNDMERFAMRGYSGMMGHPDDLNDSETKAIEQWGRNNWPKLKKMFNDFIMHCNQYSLDNHEMEFDRN